MNLYMGPNFHEALPKDFSVFIGFYFFDNNLMLCPVQNCGIQNHQKNLNAFPYIQPNKMHKFRLQWLMKDENKQNTWFNFLLKFFLVKSKII